MPLEAVFAALDSMDGVAEGHEVWSDVRELRSRAAGLKKATSRMESAAAAYKGGVRASTVAKRVSVAEQEMEEAAESQVARLAEERRQVERTAARLADVQAQVRQAQADAEDTQGVEEKTAAAQARHARAEESASALEESIDRLQQQIMDLASVVALLSAKAEAGAAAQPPAKAPRTSAGSKGSGATGTSGASVERMTLEAERNRLREELAAVQAEAKATAATAASASARHEAHRECTRALESTRRKIQAETARAETAAATQQRYAKACHAILRAALEAGSPAAALLLGLADAGGALPNSDKAAVVAAMNGVAAEAGLGEDAFGLGSMIKGRSACFGKTIRRDAASNTIVSMVPPVVPG